MTRQDPETGETNDELADALAQVEALQSAAADAEARAETVRGELAEAQAARESAETDATQLRTDLDGARSQVRESAARYRELRLLARPDVPQELVPQGETVEEIDRDFEVALKLVEQVRERVQEEARSEGSAARRIPAGSPARRAPDLSALPASEKIRLGLQQLSERPGR